MARVILFFIIYLIGFSSFVLAQKKATTDLFSKGNTIVFFVNKAKSFDLFQIKPAPKVSKQMLVSPLFYYNNLGFFCKQEIKLAKITNYRLPIAFRLGSLQYVNYLEGKPNTKYFCQ